MNSKLLNLRTNSYARRLYTTGAPGSGVGKGGGGGGTIREAGGVFGEMEAAREEQYFRKLSATQLKELKEEMERRIAYHKHHIDHHTEGLEKAQKTAKALEKH